MNRPEIEYLGIWATHNVACWLCDEGRPAVYHMDTAVFGPCWQCETVLTKTRGDIKRKPRRRWF